MTGLPEKLPGCMPGHVGSEMVRGLFNAGCVWLSVLIFLSVGIGFAGLLQAYEFDSGIISGSIDSTLSFGSSHRLGDADTDLVCIANGGTASGCNSDDGNLNYKKGHIAQVYRLTSDIEINHKSGNMGGFVRATGFIDRENDSADDTQRTPLSDGARELVGSNARLLDSYIWSQFELPGDRPAEVRLGKHVLNWGESTFIQGGINIVNPVDVAAIRLPGSELREALLPVNMLSMSLNLTENLAAESFYQLDWEETRIDPSGSYFSISDIAGEGATRVQLGFGRFSDRGLAAGPFFLYTPLGVSGGVTGARLIDTAIATDVDAAVTPVGGHGYLDDDLFYGVSRGADRKASDGGQWGIALRYFAESLNDTEFGAYYVNYHSRLPVLSAQTGTASGQASAITAARAVSVPGSNVDNILQTVYGLTSGSTAWLGALNRVAAAVSVDQYADTAAYFLEYPEDIQMLGLSFNTSVGQWAVQGEFSHKRGTPLQIDDIELLAAALTPVSPIAPATLNNQITSGAALGLNEYIRGYIRRNVSQLQVTGTRIHNNIMGADEFIFVTEAAVTHVHNMPDKSKLRLGAPGTYVSGNPAQAAAGGLHQDIAALDQGDFPDATSWGYRVSMRWVYNDAYHNFNLLPGISYQHDVEGISPGPGGNFLEGRKAVTVSIGVNHENQWAADLSVTDFFGGGNQNLLSDRDFVALYIKYFF